MTCLRVTLSLLFLAVCGVAAADGLAVIHPERDGWGVGVPAGRLEIRLAPFAARQARVARADAEARAAGPARIDRLGVPSVDRVAAEMGGWYEPEFPGESPPVPGARHDFTSFYVVHLPDGASLESAMARFGALPEVASVSTIAVMRTAVIPNDSLFASAFWFSSTPNIGATAAWDMTVGDTSIVVAVLDTGVLPYHPDLGGIVAGESGQIWTNGREASGVAGVDDDGNGKVDDLHGWDFVDLGFSAGIPAAEDWRDEDDDPNDFAGHGTEVAGLIGAIGNNGIGLPGVAWKVRLMPLRVGWSTNRDPSGLIDMLFVMRAIRYATLTGAHVLNCSFETENTDGLYAAADAANAAGVVIVSASGNLDGLHDLALRADVIAVAGTRANDTIVPTSNLGDYVDLAAPGDGMISTSIVHDGPDSLAARQPSYAGDLSGTSFAAPLVSGAVALMQAQQRTHGEPLLTPGGVRLRLSESVIDIAALNPTVTGYGTGRLDLSRAAAWPGSTVRSFGAPTVGPAVMIESPTGTPLTAYVSEDAHLVMLRGRHDTLTVAALPGEPLGALAAGVLGGRHGIGLFVATSEGWVAGFDASGVPLPGWPVAIGDESAVLTGGVALGDLDGDGDLEIVAGSGSGRIWAWNADGSLALDTALLGGGMIRTFALADIDGVPGAEIIASTQFGGLNVLTGSGASLDGWPVAAESSSPFSPVTTHATSDGDPTIVLLSRTQLSGYRATGTRRFVTSLGATAVRDPALGDLDGDGVDEIVVVTNAPATIAVYDSAGTMVPGWPIALPSSPIGPPVIAPLQGGAGSEGAEILVMLASGLAAFTNTGAVVPEFPKLGGAGASPTVVSLEGNGASQVLAGTGDDHALYVYDAGPGSADGPSPWPTPRGNFARTGSRDSIVVRIGGDPLSRVADLAIESRTDTSLTLRWSASGGAGGSGRPHDYLIRAATQPIDAANFDAAPFSRVIAPGVDPGQSERFEFSGLDRARVYWVALVSRDVFGNRSVLSNVASGATAPRVGGNLPAGGLLFARTTPSRRPVEFFWQGPAGESVAEPRLTIVDLTGRVVRVLRLASAESGVVQWNGRDEGGNLVPAGIYFARLRSGSFRVQTRVVLLP